MLTPMKVQSFLYERIELFGLIAIFGLPLFISAGYSWTNPYSAMKNNLNLSESNENNDLYGIIELFAGKSLSPQISFLYTPLPWYWQFGGRLQYPINRKISLWAQIRYYYNTGSCAPYRYWRFGGGARYRISIKMFLSAHMGYCHRTGIYALRDCYTVYPDDRFDFIHSSIVLSHSGFLFKMFYCHIGGGLDASYSRFLIWYGNMQNKTYKTFFLTPCFYSKIYFKLGSYWYVSLDGEILMHQVFKRGSEYIEMEPFIPTIGFSIGYFI